MESSNCTRWGRFLRPIVTQQGVFQNRFSAALCFLVLPILMGQGAIAQVDATQTPSIKLPLDGSDGRELLLREFRPKSQLRSAQTDLRRAKFPVVDVHTHFHHRLRGNTQALDDFVALMDRNQIAVCASLDGKLGCLLYTSPSPRDQRGSRMPSSA